MTFAACGGAGATGMRTRSCSNGRMLAGQRSSLVLRRARACRAWAWMPRTPFSCCCRCSRTRPTSGPRWRASALESAGSQTSSSSSHLAVK